MSATFSSFSERNLRRCEAPSGFNHALHSWSLSDWFTALVGELGEAANVAKKLNRIRDGIRGNKESEAELRAKLRAELADCYIYLDLLSQAAGFAIGEAVAETFDAKSRQIGYVEQTNSEAAEYESNVALDCQLQAGIARRMGADGDAASLERASVAITGLLDRVRQAERDRGGAPTTALTEDRLTALLLELHNSPEHRAGGMAPEGFSSWARWDAAWLLSKLAPELPANIEAIVTGLDVLAAQDGYSGLQGETCRKAAMLLRAFVPTHAPAGGPWRLNPENSTFVHLQDGRGGWGRGYSFSSEAEAVAVRNALNCVAASHSREGK